MAYRHASETREGSRKVWLDSNVFASWSEYLTALDAFDIAPVWRRGGRAASSERDGDSWNGGCNYAQARELAQYGWHEGVEKIQKFNDDITPYALRPQQRPQWESTVAGFLPNMPAYAAGAPDHMFIRPLTEDLAHPVVRVVCSITISAGVSADALMRRGAACLSLIDYLEASGSRVELTLHDAGYETISGGQAVRFEAMIVIKRPDEVIDLDRLAFAMVHPGMLRKLQFRMREQCPELRKDDAFSGYGSIAKYKPEPDEVYLPPMYTDYEFQTPESALKTVIGYATTALGEEKFKQDE